jgi:hypothetical protein
MTHLFRKLACRILGHSTTQVPAVFFRSWNGLIEIGSLHCPRCGKMTGEYKRNMSEPSPTYPNGCPILEDPQ